MKVRTDCFAPSCEAVQSPLLAQNLQDSIGMRTSKDNLMLEVVSLCAGLTLAGCVTKTNTEPSRSATEQLLLSTATDHALQSASFGIFASQKVFLDTSYFESYDAKYVIGTIRDALSRAGAILEDNATNSDLVIEARSGALSIDSSESLFGIPKLVAPLPLASSLQTPEVAFYKSRAQKSVAKIALLAFARASRAHVYSSGSLDGKSHDIRRRLLFVSWIRTDIPENQPNQSKSEQTQTRFPQYDPASLSSTTAPAKPSLK